MTRNIFCRSSKGRLSIPTEPLTSQEWASFGTAIGEQEDEQIPEHLRFHNPAWNLSLLKILAQERWKEQGGDGDLDEPGPINTSAAESSDISVKLCGNANHEEYSFAGIGTANVLPEGRMRKRVKQDYRIFVPLEDFSDEDDRSRGGSQLKSFGAFTGLNERDNSGPSFLSSDGISNPLLKAPYSGKKRGRPSRKTLDSSELGLINSLAQSQNVTPDDKPPHTNLLSKEYQKERRKALISAGSKLHDMDLLKRAPKLKGASNQSSGATPTKSVSPSLDPKKSGPSYTKRVSLVPGPTLTIQPTIISNIHQPAKQPAATQKQPNDEKAIRLVIPSTPSSPLEVGNQSPNSSEYESVSSANQDITFPAGQLRLSDLPRQIADTIPLTLEYFSRRDHISPLIGGNPRAVVAITTPRQNAPIQTKGYLAIQPAWNPHAPKKAGENGSMMQLSSTSTDLVSKTQENFPLFVARGRNQWEYCGQYTVAEVVKLNAFENWMHLSTAGSKLLNHWGEEILQKKYEWAKTLFIDNCGWTEEKWNKATVEDVMGPILAGKVPMHWVHLQCVGFDLVFYKALLEQKSRD